MYFVGVGGVDEQVVEQIVLYFQQWQVGQVWQIGVGDFVDVGDVVLQVDEQVVE